jgi:LacI family transcriptional regulator
MKEKTTTIVDVAKLAGVSIATVSHVINNSRRVNEETRVKVNEAINTLNYQKNSLAIGLRKKCSNSIGVIVCDLLNPAYTELLRGVESYFDSKKYDYDIIIGNTNYSLRKEEKIVRDFLYKRIDGLLLAPGENKFDHINFLINQGIPVVLIDRNIPNSESDVVFVDNRGGSLKMTEYLIKLGHKNIAIITGLMTSSTGQDRLEGYLDALKKHSIQINDNMIKFGDFREESGYHLTRELLLLNPKPTVIYACNNQMGLGVMNALKENNIKIPEQIGVTVFDDLSWFSHINPPLTTIISNPFQLGWVAAELLMERIKRRRKKIKKIVLDVDLNPRESAGEKLLLF